MQRPSLEREKQMQPLTEDPLWCFMVGRLQEIKRMCVRLVKLGERFKCKRLMKLELINVVNRHAILLHRGVDIIEGASKSLSHYGVLSISAKGSSLQGTGSCRADQMQDRGWPRSVSFGSLPLPACIGQVLGCRQQTEHCPGDSSDNGQE